ncbi:MAG TPA: response regulator [Cyanobacteria bacterium UBA11371]|nr:response regulator [Cyanobacteria bacterium UBA11371]
MQTVSAAYWLSKLDRNLLIINQKQATGELTIRSGTSQWRLCFFLGQLFYAIGENHRVRRWQRALKRHCPNWVVETDQLVSSELWECQLLHQGMAQGHLCATQVKAVVLETTQEVLFSMTRQASLSGYWQPRQYRKLQVAFYLSLCPLEVKQLIKQSQRFYEKWLEMGIGNIDPDLAPVLKPSPCELHQCSVDTFLNLTALFTGRYTLWDIALKMKQPLTRVGRLLHHFCQQGVVELQAVSDITPPFVCHLSDENIAKNQFAIACIDDSPLMGRFLKEILPPAGYRLLYVEDPIQGIGILAKYKPDLILLDLVMPDTDGYNVCNFLRHSSTFRKTPIIMLTSWDNTINRVRAKLAGVNDFLPKPFEAEQLLELIKKHLPAERQESP